jgi:hypothetical protein
MIAAIYAVTRLAALLVLLTPWSAWAECAWVLWQTSEAPGYAVSWTQQGAWSAEAECRKQRARGLTSFGIVTEIAESMWVSVPGSPTGAVVRLVCLPDTVDPRGPRTR